ncbi:unnamed protein product, partial [Porites evermanni]
MAARRSMSPVSGYLHSSESQRQSVACPSLPTVSTPLVPVFSQPLSFSISRILGLEDHNTQSRPDSGNCTNTSRQSADNSPNVDSDTDVDSGRESDADRPNPSSTKKPKKKKRRITFSPIEIFELEKVFAERPYLMPEDEDELAQKLGLATRNIRFWFQNRRAKLRRQERCSPAIPQTSFPNQFDQYQPASIHQPQLSYPVHARFQTPPLSPRYSGYSPDYQQSYRSEHTTFPCYPVRPNRFPTVDMHSQATQDFRRYLSNQYAEPSPFLPTLPSLYPTQVKTAGHLVSRDCKT